MQNIDILENYPEHMPLQCNFIFKPYVQVFTELPIIIIVIITTITTTTIIIIIIIIIIKRRPRVGLASTISETEKCFTAMKRIKILFRSIVEIVCINNANNTVSLLYDLSGGSACRRGQHLLPANRVYSSKLKSH